MNNFSTNLTLVKANAFAKKGKMGEASQLYSKILQKFPQNKLANDSLLKIHNVLAVEHHKELLSLYNQGQLDLVINKAKLLTNKFSHSVFIWNILASSYFAQENYKEAIANFRQVLKIKSDLPEVYNNIGIALSNYGKPQEAIESYNQAISIKPNYADVYNNIGVVFAGQGDLKKAIQSYEKAIKINPNYADAYNNVGIALSNSGNLEKAIESYEKAINIKPECVESNVNIVNAIKKIAINKSSPKKIRILSSVLDKKTYVRPSSISKVAINLMKFEPVIKILIEKPNLGYLKKSLHEVIFKLYEVPLLTKLMSVCPLVDIELENVLISARRILLLSVTEEVFPIESLNFLSALALQCFTNEYIYISNEKETKALNELEVLIRKKFSNGQQPSPQTVLCMATYKALHEYEWCHLLNNTPIIEEVFRRQVSEPLEECSLKLDIPVLNGVTNEISSKVRDQYEKNPYPRWVNLSLSYNPSSIAKLIIDFKLKIFNPIISKVKSPQILIAGCGTGQQSIEKASYLQNCNMLAVDLSLSSLAYAKRKTNELKIQNIEYVQSDILNLDKLKNQFDIVESVGVLHHMENPMLGWKVLVNCLKPGGLMKIGLYSEMARKTIVGLRKKINYRGIERNDNAMKLFRQEIINSNDNELKEIRIANDFYSLSMLRDLLFHVQEHRFTILQIKSCLSDLGLKFCGFEGDHIIDHFKLINANDSDIYDLDKWNDYEQKNPSSFIGMYQFWCQKV